MNPYTLKVVKYQRTLQREREREETQHHTGMIRYNNTIINTGSTMSMIAKIEVKKYYLVIIILYLCTRTSTTMVAVL